MRSGIDTFTAIWLTAVLAVTSVVPVDARAAEKGKAADDEALAEVLDVMGEGTAIVYLDSLIAPQYYNNKFIHHIFYDFAFVIDAEEWGPIRKGRLQLREAILDELNSNSFAQPGAPQRINMAFLKKRLIARARGLFGADNIKAVYVSNAVPGQF